MYFILYLIKVYIILQAMALLFTSDAERRTVDACDIDDGGLSHDLLDLKREDNRVPTLEACEGDLFSSPASSSPSDVSGKDGSFLCLVYGIQKSHQSFITNTEYYCSSSMNLVHQELRMRTGKFI